MNKKYTDLPPRSDPAYARLWRETKQNKDTRKAYAKRYYLENRNALLQKDKSRREQSPATYRERVWSQQGIVDFSYALYLEMLNRQEHRCAICQCHLKRPMVDHDHKTGKVRGIVCHACNKALGFLNDDITTIKRMIEYLA